jgi:hypothetical protein
MSENAVGRFAGHMGEHAAVAAVFVEELILRMRLEISRPVSLRDREQAFHAIARNSGKRERLVRELLGVS